MSPPTARVRLAVCAAALGLGGLSLAVAVTSDHTDARGVLAALGLAVGWSFAASGLVAWTRRPGSRTGPLMVALGLVWLVGSLQLANSSPLYTVGLLTAPLALALAVHLVLAFPEGVLEGGTARLAVGAAYVDATVLQLALLLLYEPRAPRFDCERCPENALLVTRNDTVADAIITAQNVLGIAIAAGMIVLLRRRWREATAPARRALAPVIFTGGTAAASGVLLFVSVAAGSSIELPARVATHVALATVPLAFLAGLLHTRLARTAVSRLVIELGGAPAPGRVREAIARALHDPSLELAYWLPESSTYVDAHGRPVELPGPGSGRAAAPVEREGRLIGVLVHDATLADQPELVDGVRAAAGLALENVRLQAELRARLDELRASRVRLVEAGDAERRRLERNLHDGAQQRLVSLALSLRLAAARVRTDPAAAEELLAAAGEELGLALEELRELARGIHPAILTDRGLGPALEALAARSPVPVEVTLSDGDKLPDPIAAAAYFVVSEALANVVKYAGATAVSVRVASGGGGVHVEVADDGAGGADPARGSGLRGLADRVEALDGRLVVESPRGAGTRVRAELPLRARG